MFGYVVANVDALNPKEKKFYRECYCGLCHELGKRHGQTSRITLTYDMTFLIILLSSIYDVKSSEGIGRCLPHPLKRHSYYVNEITGYAADMNVALAYYNCLDNWNDDKSLVAIGEAKILKRQLSRIERIYPRQCNAIKECLYELSRLEQADELNPDKPAACFGRLMGELFLWREDELSDSLKAFGDSLGRFIYILDACIDLKKDIKGGKYNPMIMTPSQDFKEILVLLMAGCTEQYSRLPISRNKGIIDNILYSGVWIRYEAVKKIPKEEKK